VILLNFSISEKYILLAFALDNIIGKGKVVDAYYGDKELLKTCPNLNPIELKEKLLELMDEINLSIEDNHPYYRKTYLLKQVDALITQVNLFFNKAEMKYRDALSILLDITPSDPNYIKIEELKAEINTCLLKKATQAVCRKWFQIGKKMDILA
jgi:hypothetical protein